MDGRHFDHLARALSEAGSRRGLLGLLASLPALGGLLALLGLEGAEARKNRRKGRKKPHKRAKRRRKKQKQRKGKKQQKCRADSRAKTCANRCGIVKNNCGKAIDCGSCDCNPTCEECLACQGEPGVPGTCVPLDAGTPCGDPATCVDGTRTPRGNCDGSGVCEPGTPISCDPYTRCDGNACATTCADDHDCVAGAYCNGEQRCVGDQDNGQPCTHGGQCASGFCVDEVCCASASCPTCQACNVGGDLGACVANPDQVGDACGSDGQVCQANGSCACQAGSCANPTPMCDASGLCVGCGSDSECTAAGAGNLCCAGSCFTGICCADAACTTVEAPDCVGHDCVCTANSNAACAAGETCCDDGCGNLDTDPNHCGSCAGSCTGTTPICAGGSCVACSATNPCPAGQCCAADGSCGANCPPCQTCAGGVCVADASQDGSCCAGGEGQRWCQAGACVAVPATATSTQCQGLCNDSTTFCGATTACPSCTECSAQTGCPDGIWFLDGPRGPGTYCSKDGERGDECSPFFSPCPAGLYCADFGLANRRCMNICPA